MYHVKQTMLDVQDEQFGLIDFWLLKSLNVPFCLRMVNKLLICEFPELASKTATYKIE